jgi:hypothetical protein
MVITLSAPEETASQVSSPIEPAQIQNGDVESLSAAPADSLRVVNLLTLRPAHGDVEATYH